jgi:hypothetical protein
MSRRPILPAAEVIARLGRKEGPAFRSADLAFQFGTEDGSDRSFWRRPGEQLAGLPSAYDNPLDRLLRAVLDRWDLKEPEGWREILRQASDNQPEDSLPTSDLALQLSRFTSSELFTDLAASQKCYRTVEYLLNLHEPQQRAVGITPTDHTAGINPAARTPLPLLRGVIDYLWQDAHNHWHLASLVQGASSCAPESQRAALVLAALALRPRLGDWPADVSCYEFTSGQLTRWSGRRLPHRQVLAAVRKLVSATIQRPLSD